MIFLFSRCRGQRPSVTSPLWPAARSRTWSFLAPGRARHLRTVHGRFRAFGGSVWRLLATVPCVSISKAGEKHDGGKFPQCRAGFPRAEA